MSARVKGRARFVRLVVRTTAAGIAVVTLIWTFVWPGTPEAIRAVAAYMTAESPHARHAATLHLMKAVASVPRAAALKRAAGVNVRRAADTDAWLRAADESLRDAERATPPFSSAGTFTRPGDAASWRLSARRGHRITVDGEFAGGVAFVDLYGSDGAHLASAGSDGMSITVDVEADDDLVLRVQPPLGTTGAYRISEQSGPSMGFPVRGMGGRAIRSQFGAERDAGRRSHEGIDIFAPRGTPVIAAMDGWVGRSLANTLGGNVIWVWSPGAGLSAYYAHLERHAASPGQRVHAGDVLGFVGNTGNARGGPAHLHFGVYVAGEGSVDPLPYVCGAACAP